MFAIDINSFTVNFQFNHIDIFILFSYGNWFTFPIFIYVNDNGIFLWQYNLTRAWTDIKCRVN